MPKSFLAFLKQGLLYPKRFLEGRMQASTQSVESLKLGQGAVVEINGKKIAAYKDPSGRIILHSAVCTHMKCIVQWNQTEKTFDCPCHGSRFEADGQLKNGPAERGLDPAE